jgi:exonuclease 3'-5' domain-containing protein 1
VRDETKRRVASTHAPDYQSHGKERALAPWNNAQNIVLDRLNVVCDWEDYFDTYEEYGNDDDEDYYGYEDDNDFEDFPRMPWQGPPS